MAKISTPPRARAMAAARDATAAVHELVEIRLRQGDLRYTAGRRAIVETLITSGQPVSIGDIERLCPRVPRSSAYRHLLDLQNAGVVRRVTANDEFSRYEMAENFSEHHHHLICTRCGAVTDVTPSPRFESEVAQVVTEISDKNAFDPISHELDVFGHCAQCR